jgi:hypothetical protein
MGRATVAVMTTIELDSSAGSGLSPAMSLANCGRSARTPLIFSASKIRLRFGLPGLDRLAPNQYRG